MQLFTLITAAIAFDVSTLIDDPTSFVTVTPDISDVSCANGRCLLDPMQKKQPVYAAIEYNAGVARHHYPADVAIDDTYYGISDSFDYSMYLQNYTVDGVVKRVAYDGINFIVLGEAVLRQYIEAMPSDQHQKHILTFSLSGYRQFEEFESANIKAGQSSYYRNVFLNFKQVFVKVTSNDNIDEIPRENFDKVVWVAESKLVADKMPAWIPADKILLEETHEITERLSDDVQVCR